MSLAILFHFLCAQHVSDINISIIRSLRLFYWITTLVVLFLVRCVLDFRCGWVGVVSVLQAETQHVEHKKWNKIASDIKLVFYSSTITMMHGPINIRCTKSCFIISLLYASTSFEHYVLIIRRSKLYYTASGIVTLCRWPSGARVESAQAHSQPAHRTATYRVWRYQMLYNTILTSWWWAHSARNM